MIEPEIKPLTHVGMIPIAEARRLIAWGIAKGLITFGNAPRMAPGEDPMKFLTRAGRQQTVIDNHNAGG